MVRLRLLPLMLTLFALGCSRPTGGHSSRITIQSPEAFGKVGSLSFPVGRKACYAAIVSGPDIGGEAPSSCSPQTGLMLGFVEAGQNLEATVKRGNNRQIDLYVLLKNAGDNSACPKLGAKFIPGQLTNIYILGSARNLNFSRDVEEVVINASFPGETNHLAAQLAMPASCTAGSGSLPGFHVSTSMQTVSGGGLKLRARIGKIGSEATGGGMKLRMK